MKYIIIMSSFLVLIGLFVFPLSAHALVPPLMPFGGLSVFTVPCTCSVALWGYFAPLYLSSIPVTGPMVYAPWATIPFLNFLPTIASVAHKGVYIPGIQACWMYAGVTCFPLPAVGMMTYVGTGLPGSVK